MTQIRTSIAFLTLLIAPGSAFAYLEPEDVLLNRELFLPPSAREAIERTDIQAQEAAARREREQERAFALQHPVVEEEVVSQEESDTLHGAAPTALPPGAFYAYPVPMQNGAFYGQPMFMNAQPNLDAANLELARTMRLLTRVNQNQAASELQSVLHSSAGGLAPTGAGTVLAALTLMGAVIYTLWKARAAKAIMKI